MTFSETPDSQSPDPPVPGGEEEEEEAVETRSPDEPSPEPVPQSSPLPISGEGSGERARNGTKKPKPRRLLHAVLAVLALVALFVLYQLVTWPDVAALAREAPETTAFIERYRQTHDGPVRRTWVSYERISPHLKRAVLVAEDINFFDHRGFETREIRQALEKAWEDKEFPRGASTLTQQLAKNLWLSPSRNPLRKLEEAILTRQLEAHLTKRRIFELYLNVVEFGPGVYGAEAAARHWFGTSAAGLTELQAAQLAASLPRPKTWNPGSDSRAYQRRVQSIRQRMDKAAWLWKVI